MTEINLSIAFLSSIGLALALTPLAIVIAKRFEIVDRKSTRGVNDRQGMPLFGGFAVFTATIGGIAVYSGLSDEPFLSSPKIQAFVGGGLLLFLVGAWDDRLYLSARTKLPFQLAAALIAIWGGFEIEYLSEPFTNTTHDLPSWISWPLTIVWIVGVTNALNLMDGLDGLTTGVGAIISLTLVAICWQVDQRVGILIGGALFAGLLGFLPYNFPPARIFLGDAGATFIGFTLALVSIQGYRKAALLTFVVPLLALAVPLLDTFLSIVRRVRMGKNFWDPDDMHIHHRILQVEGSQRRAVIWLYFQTACFGILAVSFSQLRGYTAILFLVVIAFLTVRLLRNLGLFSFRADPDQE